MHFVVSASCSLLLSEHLWGLQPSLGALHWKEWIPESKTGCYCVGGPLHWAFSALSFAESLPLSRSQNHRNVVRKALWRCSPSSRLQQGWHWYSGQPGLCLAEAWKPARVETTRPLWDTYSSAALPLQHNSLSCCSAWSSQARVCGSCHIICNYQEAFGSIFVTVLQTVLGSYEVTTQPGPPQSKSNSFHHFSRGHALEQPEHLRSPSLEPLPFFWQPCWPRPKAGQQYCTRCLSSVTYQWISVSLDLLSTYFLMEPRLWFALLAVRTLSWPTFNLASTVSPILFSRAAIQLAASQPLVYALLCKQLPCNNNNSNKYYFF